MDIKQLKLKAKALEPSVRIGKNGITDSVISEIAKHLKKNPKDINSRRGLLGMVAKRQKTLKYLEKKNPKTHKSLLKKLNLK
jgi:ribosomal protein S15